jgi:hypothetical protein
MSRPYTGLATEKRDFMNISVPPQLKAKIMTNAQLDNRSASNFIERIILRHFESEDRREAAKIARANSRNGHKIANDRRPSPRE